MFYPNTHYAQSKTYPPQTRQEASYGIKPGCRGLTAYLVEGQEFEVYAPKGVNPQGCCLSYDHAISFEMAKEVSRKSARNPPMSPVTLS